MKQQINVSKSSSHSFSILYYKENETIDIRSLKDNSVLEIATGLATRFRWRKLVQNNMDVTRLEGQLLIDESKYWLVSGNKVSDTSQNRPLLYCGLLDMGKLLTILSKMGINGSIEQGMNAAESESVGIIKIHDPNKAMIEVKATSTVISASDENLAARIFEAITSLLDGI